MRMRDGMAGMDRACARISMGVLACLWPQVVAGMEPVSLWLLVGMALYRHSVGFLYTSDGT